MPATYFVAELDCPACGKRSPRNGSIGLVTHFVPAGPGQWTTGEQDESFCWTSVRDWYPVLKEPAPGEPVELLELWWCPSCGADNWARLTFSENVLTRFEAVPLDRKTVASAHAINSEVAATYASRTGERLFRDGKTGFRDRLLAALRP